jgi:ribosomal protein L15
MVSLSGAKKNPKKVGRGNASGHGTSSTRGGKGQTARAGNKRRPELRDIIKKLPKNRGYSFKSKKRPFILASDKILSTDTKVEKFSEIRKRLNIKGRKILIK